MRLKYIYFSGLGQKDVYAILWYEIDLIHRVSQASLSHVSYVVKEQHLSLRGLRRQKSEVYFYLSKFCCGLGHSPGQLSCVFVGSVIWSLWTLWHFHFNTCFCDGCCKKKVMKGYPPGAKELCFGNRMYTASAYSPWVRWVPWLFLMQTGPGKYGLCASGNEEDMDTEEPK